MHKQKNIIRRNKSNKKALVLEDKYQKHVFVLFNFIQEPPKSSLYNFQYWNSPVDYQ